MGILKLSYKDKPGFDEIASRVESWYKSLDGDQRLLVEFIVLDARKYELLGVIDDLKSKTA